MLFRSPIMDFIEKTVNAIDNEEEQASERVHQQNDDETRDKAIQTPEASPKKQVRNAIDNEEEQQVEDIHRAQEPNEDNQSNAEREIPGTGITEQATSGTRKSRHGRIIKKPQRFRENPDNYTPRKTPRKRRKHNR